MKRWQFSLALAGAALVAVLAGFATTRMIPRPTGQFRGTTYETVAPAADFRLTDHEGRAVTLESYRGRPVLLFFGYTHCPDVCPLTLARLSRVLRSLGDDARGTQVLLVTVDPARDTPAALKAYTSRFGPWVTGLTGDSASLARAWEGYGAYVQPVPAPAARAAAADSAPAADPHAGHDAPKRPAGAAVAHSGVIYGIDRRGDLQVVISDAASEEDTRHDVRALARL